MLSFTWITPTWNRPTLLRELVRQFWRQDYPPELLSLLILDDAGQYHMQSGERWELITYRSPFATLPEKYNALLAMVTTDAVVIAEDDDIYDAGHTAACMAALEHGDVCKPSIVKTHVHGVLKDEDASGRFHASLAFRTDPVRAIGGWPVTRRADFDLQMISKLESQLAIVDPIKLGHTPTYTFTWESSGHYHAQAYGRGPTDEGWLERARDAAGQVPFIGDLFQTRAIRVGAGISQQAIGATP